MSPGGLSGLQNRACGVCSFIGVFDSHILPPYIDQTVVVWSFLLLFFLWLGYISSANTKEKIRACKKYYVMHMGHF